MDNISDYGAWVDGYPEGVTWIEVLRSKTNVNDIYFTTAKLHSERKNVMWMMLFAIIMFSLRLIFFRIIKTLAMRAGARKPRHIYGLQENGFYCIYYIFASIAGLYIYSLENWGVLTESRDLWRGFPLQPFSWAFRTYYHAEAGFYLHLIASLLFERRKKDFAQLTVHHFATFALVTMSYYGRMHRVGLVIFILHNISDIPLYFGKCIIYFGKATDQGSMALYSQISLVVFAIGFFVLRLVFFPFVVIRSCLFESDDVGSDAGPPMGFFVANGFLLVLLTLHLYWFYLIVAAASRQLNFNSKKVLHDTRENYDSDEDGSSSSSPKSPRAALPDPKSAFIDESPLVDRKESTNSTATKRSGAKNSGNGNKKSR